MVEICHAATAWHFATKTIGMGFPGWSGFATLLQPDISRPFFSRKPSDNGRDLLLCYSLAFRDRFSAESRLKVVGICHPTTVRQIPTVSPAPPPPPPPMPPAGPAGPPPPAARRPVPAGPPPPAPRSAGPRKLRRLSPPGTPSCSGRIGIDLRCICLAVGAAGRGTCV